MSLRPVTRSRRRQWRRTRLNGQKKWASNWSWNDVKRFEPSKHKRGLLVLSLIIILAFIAVWAQDQSNPLFHNVKANPDFHDPTNVLWQETFGANDLSGLNCNRATFVNAGGGQLGATLASDNNGPALCLFKSSLDMSTVGQKSVWFQLGAVPSGIGFDFDWFLTTNSTLTGIGPDANYNPASDNNVALLHRLNGQGSSNYLENVLMQRSQTVAIANSQYPTCQAGSGNGVCFIVTTQNNGLFPSIALSLNFTGGNAGSNSGSFVSINAGSSPTTVRETPWLQFQAVPYYLGFWVAKGAGNSVEFISQFGTHSIQGTNYEMCSTVGGECMSMTSYVVVAVTPTIDTGGFFGPVIKALINLGVFILNALLSFVAFIAPAIQSALNFLETQIINILNLIGNALGFGNIGSDLSTFITNMVTFFTNGSYGLPAFFGFFGTYFTNFLRWLQIDFNFIGPIFSIANAILIFGVNGIVEAIAIMTIGLQMFLFGYGTLIVFAYFIYVGDDGIGGLFTFLGTLEAISFKILNSIVIVTNLGLDFLIMMISLIPKPFIQMTATRVPRLPTIESNASMSFPTLDFGEARNGNLIVYWLWCMGLWFVAWFESQNPSLPGSIGMLDPAVASNVRQLSAYIPLLQAMTLISGGLVVIWFSMLPLRLAGIDVTEAPIGASLGRRAGPGPSSVHISGGKKHLIGPAKKAEQLRQAQKGSKAKKEEQAKEAIEKRKKELEEKKRSEELRQRELARKPTGKDIRGPNL